MMKTGVHKIRLASLLALTLGGLVSFHAVAAKKQPLRVLAVDQAIPAVVIYEEQPGEAPLLRWRWVAKEDPNIPPKEVMWRFGNPSECKVREDGKTIIMAASGGYCAGIDVATGKCKWYVNPAGNPHSVELLPDGRVAAACSDGNALMLIDVNGSPLKLGKQIKKKVLDLKGGHGVHWDAKRKSLFALGYDTFYELEYDAKAMSVRVRRSWDYTQICGNKYGHDLTPDGKGGYFFSTQTAVWFIDPDKGKIEKARDLHHVKGFSPSADGDLVTIPNERWWTDTLLVFPSGSSDSNLARKITVPGAKFYKARHFPQMKKDLLPKKKSKK